ncbi:MAG TPA: hypothetical protein DCM68_04955 [Verrucomicrobia bacterium]|nr:hypothetical protein [Verrucomicrobiota bacterium]
MNRLAGRIRKWIWMLPLIFAAGALGGCDDSDFDRDPPEGQGSMVVDNYTGDRVRVYIEGERVDSVGEGDHRYYDLDPGVYRVALDGDDTDRSWAGDVDILENRRTVLEVRGYSGDYDEFDVRIYFD